MNNTQSNYNFEDVNQVGEFISQFQNDIETIQFNNTLTPGKALILDGDKVKVPTAAGTFYGVAVKDVTNPVDQDGNYTQEHNASGASIMTSGYIVVSTNSGLTIARGSKVYYENTGANAGNFTNDTSKVEIKNAIFLKKISDTSAIIILARGAKV